MKSTAKLVSWIALALTVVPSLLFFAGLLGHDLVKWLALIGTIGWLCATPLWMGRELQVDASQVEI
ncbi:MAG: hypothetical protein KDB22_13015 [Planctomycetales bacterium]|nr:hypothetical protein [Planctomycetales bacterium]